MPNRIVLLLAFLCGFHLMSHSQCAALDFNIPENACVGDTLQVSIGSGSFLDYQIDASPGDLMTVPTATNFTSIQGLMSYPRTISMVNDSNTWYGFVGDNSASTVYRLNFGNSLENTPTLDTLDFTNTASNPGGTASNGNQAFAPYPNPVGNSVTIPVLTPESAVEFDIEVYRADGAVIKKETGTTVEGYNPINLEMSDLNAGAYLLSLKLGEATFNYTIIKR